MKKTLIALTLAALPVAAMAEVTLYGTIKGGLEFTKVKGVDNTITDVNDWDSKIGFKGEEDLGSGLKAIWQVEQKISLDSQSTKRNQQFANLDSFIGLDTGFGKVRAGFLSDSINNMGDLNLSEGNGWLDLDPLWGRTEGRATGVRYDSPDFAGLSFNALYSPEDNNRYNQARKAVQGSPDLQKALDWDGGDLDGFDGVVGVVNGATTNKWIGSVGVNYAAAGFWAKYGYKHTHNNAGKNKDGHVHRLMGGYDANNIFAGLGYQYTKNVDGADVETQEIAASAAYTMGNIVPHVSLVYGFEEKVGGKKRKDSDYIQAIVGADYNLSKRTSALVNVGYFRSDDGDYQAYTGGVGLRHKF